MELSSVGVPVHRARRRFRAVVCAARNGLVVATRPPCVRYDRYPSRPKGEPTRARPPPTASAARSSHHEVRGRPMPKYVFVTGGVTSSLGKRSEEHTSELQSR